jgi:hypothetical protein
MNYGWNQTKFEDDKRSFEIKLRNKSVTPYDLMQEYKRRVVLDDFEACKAITEVLKPLNYDTADTHTHIHQLKEKT